ncbi:uncharacterized protein ANIA_11540 [Aspergillus nidulans FGSC A4]|uniref:Uncharacterized protein n=1 Tax=Emericella nidulans (strain FGSC A4 / ATCC 38163 / CBS 112.46 / NRRL 194 / M139) TaxID=227321 RepID=C8VC78_EMENI|nr:hypothetical protein [Aspergillus nidulans FGSC A4]CBF79248.1 TPA: hypothetical protein ANIA_11540 [Aspergillus nidulans FGSC A4]
MPKQLLNRTFNTEALVDPWKTQDKNLALRIGWRIYIANHAGISAWESARYSEKSRIYSINNLINGGSW